MARYGNSTSFVSIEVKGKDEILALLRQLPEELGVPVLKRALLSASRLMLDEVKRRTPVELVKRKPKGREGQLYQSMRSRYGRTDDKNVAKVLVGTKLWYAYYLEFGTVRMQPLHFMRDAFESTKDEVADRFSVACGERVTKALNDYEVKRSL